MLPLLLFHVTIDRSQKAREPFYRINLKMAPLSRSQFKPKVTRILLNISTTRSKDRIPKNPRDVAKTTLGSFSPQIAAGSSSSDASIDPPDSEEVSEYLKDLLPQSAVVYKEEFFALLMFPLRVLYEVAGLYGITEVPVQYKNELNATPTEKIDKTIKSHIWLCFFMNGSIGTCRMVLQKHKNIRGSHKPFLRGTGNLPSPEVITGSFAVQNPIRPPSIFPPKTQEAMD